MAARRARRKGRRRKRSASWSRIGVIAVLVGAVLYVVFTRALFDPFEEPVASFELLVPRDVDLFVWRQGLGQDFDSLPLPREVERLVRTPGWETFASSPAYAAADWPGELAALGAELVAVNDQLPIDLMDDLLGAEVAVIGRRPGRDDGELALLARLSSAGKLAVEALSFEGIAEGALVGASQQEVTSPSDPELRYMRIDLPEGDPVFYTRRSDLLLVSQSEALVTDVLGTLEDGPSRSLGLSRHYDDDLPEASGSVGSLFTAPVAFDGVHMLEAWDLLPDRSTPDRDALADILPSLVDLTLIEDVVGRVEIDRGDVALRLHAETNVSRARADRGGLVGQPPFKGYERLRDALGVLPADTTVAVSMRVDLARFLRTVTAGLSPDLLTLINTTLRDVARYSPSWDVSDTSSLIGALDRALQGQLTLALRPLDHKIPEGSQPVPSLAFLFNVRDVEAWTEIEDALLRGFRAFGLSSDDMWQADEGVGSRRWLTLEGLPIEEVAYIVLDDETLAVTTDNDFLTEIVAVYTGSGRASLASTGGALDMLKRLERGNVLANAVGYADADGLADVLEPYAPWVADQETVFSFGVRRVELRRELIASDWPEHDVDIPDEKLPAAVRDELNARLDELIAAEERQRVEVEVPRLAQEWRDGWAWLEILRQGAFALRMGERSAELDLRLKTVAAP